MPVQHGPSAQPRTESPIARTPDLARAPWCAAPCCTIPCCITPCCTALIALPTCHSSDVDSRGLDLNSESANASRPMPNSDLSACRAPAPLSDSQRSPRCARSCVAARHYTPRTWRVVLSQSSACHPTQVHAAALVSRLASRVVSRCVRCFSRRFAPRVGLLHSSCAASHSVPHFVPRCVPRFALRFEPRFVPCCVHNRAHTFRTRFARNACVWYGVFRAKRVRVSCVSRSKRRARFTRNVLRFA